VLTRVSSPRRRPLIFSIRQTGVPLGGLLAGAAVPSIVLLFGWRGAALAVGGLALVVLAAVQPVRDAFDADRRPDLPLAVAGIAAPLKLLRADPMLRALAAAGFAYAGCQTSVAAFFVLYLTDALGMPLIQAGLVLAVVQAGGIAGRLFWGALSGSVVSARAVLAGLGVMMAACLAATAVLTADWPPALLTILALALGASSFGWNGVYLSEVASRAPEGAIGQATGAVQFVMFAGVVVVPPGFGALVAVTHSYAAAFLAVAAVALGTGLYLRRAYTAGRTGVSVSGKGETG
jgi:predicted MFS family arabinose efflux permease